MPKEAGPTPPSERIVALDALRGFALLGILIINIRVLSMPEIVLLNPTAYGDFSGANYVAWLLGDIFARQKFITLFTVLYGAGIVLFTRSVAARDGPVLLTFFRRSGWLIVFGLGHAYLLWYGDILVAYGICGLGLVFLRHHPPGTLAKYGLYLVAIPSVIEVAAMLTLDPGAIIVQVAPPESEILAEVETYQSGWVEQMNHRVPAAYERQTTGFVGNTAWRAGGSMLFGMALFKWGVLTEERSTSWYGWLIAGGALSGLVVILAGIIYIESRAWAPEAIVFWRQFNYWGSFALAGSYVGVIMLYTRARPDGVLTLAFAAVGRTAFSNYILQTVLATWIFYGHGLGLFGDVSRLEALGIVVVIWAIQVPLSVLWLRYFRYGPLEWLWRVLTYRQLQPIRVDAQ